MSNDECRRTRRRGQFEEVPAVEEHGSVPEEGLQRRQGVVNQRIGPYQQAIRARGGEEAEVVWNGVIPVAGVCGNGEKAVIPGHVTNVPLSWGRLETVYLSMAGARCSLLNTPRDLRTKPVDVHLGTSKSGDSPYTSCMHLA